MPHPRPRFTLVPRLGLAVHIADSDQSTASVSVASSSSPLPESAVQLTFAMSQSEARRVLVGLGLAQWGDGSDGFDRYGPDGCVFLHWDELGGLVNIQLEYPAHATLLVDAIDEQRGRLEDVLCQPKQAVLTSLQSLIDSADPPLDPPPPALDDAIRANGDSAGMAGVRVRGRVRSGQRERQQQRRG